MSGTDVVAVRGINPTDAADVLYKYGAQSGYSKSDALKISTQKLMQKLFYCSRWSSSFSHSTDASSVALYACCD